MNKKNLSKPTILVVDDELNNIKLICNILESKYNMRIAVNGFEALERVHIEPMPSLILLDIRMPEMDGITVCKRLKADPATAKIPVIFVTANTEIENEKEGFDVGCVDYITKPVSIPIVMARVDTHIALADQQRASDLKIAEQTKAISQNQIDAINMLGMAGHYNDTDTGEHIWRMAAYARALAQELDWSVDAAANLELAATMHDTGKIGISDSILKAPRRLTEDELVEMRKHTDIGYSILKKISTPIFEMASQIALFHHEKWDGTGYPRGLIGNAIPESARIVAVADVFDALTMKRAYKDPWTPDEAFLELEKSKGSHFDPYFIDKFLDISSKILTIMQYWNKS